MNPNDISPVYSSADAQAAGDRNEQAVRTELEKYESQGELAPGSAAILGNLWKSHGNLAPPALAEQVSRMLASPAVARFKNPEHAVPTLENGSAPSPLRQVLSRHAAGLKPGAVDALSTEWQSQLGHLDSHKLAGEVASRLASRDVAERHAAVPPPTPYSEVRLRDVIAAHFPEVDGFKLGGMARELARDVIGLDRKPDHEIARHVAKMLTVTPHAAKWTRDGSPLDRSDRRLTQPGQAPGPAPRTRLGGI